MNGIPINPYALYVYCDGAMDYDSKNTGGVGFEIRFPDFIDLEGINKTIGRYERANIERLELEAILQGMNELLKLFKNNREKLKNINTIIFITDRMGLNDKERTSPYKIREWRRNKWHNHEGKAIKNSDLLDKLDKTRKKLTDQAFCSLEIRYGRRKFNKKADKLAKAGKKHAIVKENIALKGTKIGRRKYDNVEVDYGLLKEEEEYLVHVFKKEPVRDQWEIWVDICDGVFVGRKLRIYTDSEIERKIHRHHKYKIRIRNVFAHHVAIYEAIEEVQNDEASITK